MPTPRPPAPVFGGKPLSRRTLRVIRAIAARMFDGGAGIPEARLDRFVGEVAEWSRWAGPKTRFALTMAAIAVQNSPALVVGKPRRFTALDPATQTRHLEGMEHGAFFALPFAGLKTVMSIIWFDDVEVHELPHQARKDRSVPAPTAGREVAR